MNFVKRGMTSVIRKPGKTIILLLIVFILGNIICGAISVQQAVANTDKILRAQMSPAAMIDFDYDKLEEESAWENVKYTSLEAINKIGQLPHVASYDYYITTYLNSLDLQYYYSDTDTGYDGYRSFNLIGGQNTEVLDIESNIIKLVSGRTFTSDEMNSLSYVALISKELANLNGLTVGSKFTMDNVIYEDNYSGNYETYSAEDEGIYAMQSYEFEVIGIFEPTKKYEENNDKAAAFMLDEQLQNQIYTTNKVTESINEFSSSVYAEMYADDEDFLNYSPGTYYDTLYIVDDHTNLEEFKKQANELLSEFFIMSDVSDTYKDVAAPMETLQSIAVIVLYVAVGASLIILSLLITLFLRDRKHEIGIYLSLGEKRIKVVSQIILEVVVVAAVAITFSLFSGNLLARSVSDTMLNNQIIAQQKDNDGSYSVNSIEMRGYGMDISTEDMVQTYSVSLSSTTILLFFAIGLGTVVVSTLVPIVYITRLNPKKIMM